MSQLRKMHWWWLARFGSREIWRLDDWRSRSSRTAVPLTRIQSQILRLLASHRDPESYVAGATPLNRTASRYSSDIDAFHDREERIASAALGDGEALRAAGCEVAWLRQLPLVYTTVTLENASTRLEWVCFLSAQRVARHDNR